MSWFYPKYWNDENSFLKEMRRKLPVIPGSGTGGIVTFTTTGTSGAATWNSGTGTLNIPIYSGGGGTVTGGANGASLNGANIELGTLSAGTGAPFTATRFIDFNNFNLEINTGSGRGLFFKARSAYEFMHASFVGFPPAQPFQFKASTTPDGVGGYDLQVFQGFNVDSSFDGSQPSWTDRWEYAYAGNLYERHIQWSSPTGGRLYRFLSFTLGDHASNLTDDVLTFFTTTGLEARNLLGTTFWSVSNGLGGSADVATMGLYNRAGTKQLTFNIDDANNACNVNQAAGSMQLQFNNWPGYTYQYQVGGGPTMSNYWFNTGTWNGVFFTSSTTSVIIENPTVYTAGDGAVLSFTPSSGAGAVRGYIQVHQGVGMMQFQVQGGGYFHRWDQGATTVMTLQQAGGIGVGLHLTGSAGSGYTEFSALNSSNEVGQLAMFSPSFASTGVALASGALVSGNATGGLSLAATHTSGVILFAAGGLTEAARFAATGKFVFTGSSTTRAVMNLGVGSAPSSPVDGDIWREDNTNTGIKARVNGVTKTVTLS